MRHAQIVWLASFPKSGNTWFRTLLANLNAGENGPMDINAMSMLGTIASSRQEFEDETLVDSSLLSYDDIDSLRPRVYKRLSRNYNERLWIKVHDAYALTTSGEPIFGNSASRAVYLVRDPRDVAVSYARHEDCTIDRAIKVLSKRDGALATSRIGVGPQLRQKLLGWSTHVTSWLDQRNLPVHLIRYEDLFAAPAEYFSAALSFAGQSASRDDVERAVRNSDFVELQMQEKANGFRERVSRKHPFFHTGKVGAWRTHLTTEQADAIIRCHGDVMARLGYEL